jgi:hypothetical protein
MSSVSSTRRRNSALLAAVRQRLEEDPDTVLPTLRLLVDPEASADPLDENTLGLAKTLNAHRMVAGLRELRARSYSTEQVGELLGGISRQAVSQRVAKGQLMSIQISGKAWFPDWQFVEGRPADRLPEVIAAFRELGEDTFSADAVMRTRLPEENDRTPAELLAAGQIDRALHYVWAIGGGF